MSKRINPDTGVIEERDGFLNDLLDIWEPERGPDNEITRVNPGNGEIEEQRDFFDNLLGIWHPKK